MRASSKKLLPYRSPWQVLATWPPHQPLIFLGGDSRHAIFAVKFREIPAASVLQREFGVTRPHGLLPFYYGLVGLVSYDDYGPGPLQRRSRFFQVDQALVCDQENEAVFLTGAPGENLEVPWATVQTEEPGPAASLLLKPREDDDSYLRKAGQVIEEIRDGRYYQLNLLRYFDVEGDPGDDWIISRLKSFGGPYSSWFRLGDESIVSFSPERFIRLMPNGSLEARPIKGTIHRGGDPDQDRLMCATLLASAKDRSELAIITDLLRNDLNRVGSPQTVSVTKPVAVLALPQLYHLYADIAATPRPGLTFGEFLAAVCPAGSITGAPKKEVMKAIYEAERRPRGWFMGLGFYWDRESGCFDSAVLIRTMTRTRGNPYEFAAGSGIVLGSQPEQELAEINLKCGVVGIPAL